MLLGAEVRKHYGACLRGFSGKHRWHPFRIRLASQSA